MVCIVHCLICTVHSVMSAQFFLFDLSSLLNPKPKLTFKKNNLNQSVMHIHFSVSVFQ